MGGVRGGGNLARRAPALLTGSGVTRKEVGLKHKKESGKEKRDLESNFDLIKNMNRRCNGYPKQKTIESRPVPWGGRVTS